MNNKLLAALALTTALATGANAQCQINSGAYVGLSVGGAHLGGKNDATHTNDQPGNQSEETKNSLSKTSFAATLFAGYGFKFNNLWTAAELFYQFDQLKNTSKLSLAGSGNKNLESQSNGSFGAALHFGFIPTPSCVAYLIAGVEVRRFKVKFSDKTTPISLNTSVDKSYTSTAFAPGLGVRFSLSKNLSLRTEYKCAMHRNKSFSDTKLNPVPLAGKDSINIKHSPYIHSLNVGLVYNF